MSERVPPEPGIEEKAAFLSKPEAYPTRPRCVELRETHMSCVFLAGDYVWKLKKPARYDYLDFSTREARKLNCEREVELNRRLAPGVYLGVVPLTIDRRGQMHLGGDGEVIDWLVMMRRLPQNRMLNAAVAEHTVTREDVLRAAGVLAEFYQRATRVPFTPAEYARRLEAEIMECAAELLRPEYALPAGMVEAVREEQIASIRSDTRMFDQRAKNIVDAHGDLRPEHICLLPEPVIIDCLEFNADFRALDPVSELAFLSLECDRLGAPWVGNLILDTYCRSTGDRPPERLVAFYKRQHASIRAKIAVWHIQDHVPNPERWIEKAKDYLERARSLQQVHN
jgi:aminoglycoside phosphotransferase family enzyme